MNAFLRRFSFALGFGCAMAGPAGGAQPLPATVQRPNVLMIIADQWRAQAFGFAGDANVRTPHLDQLERESVNFTQAVSGMPVCSPTRASLLTGQRPLTHGIFLNDLMLDPGAVTIAKALAGAGYDTGCIGKWHVDGHGRSSFIPRERRQGFDYWKVLECTHAYNNSPYYADGPEKLKWEDYDAIAQTHDAQRYLEGRAKTGKPFLLWLAWGPPHNPYETAPAKYRAMYPPEKIKLRGNVPPEAQAKARADLAGYYAHCTALDDCVGELMATLQRAGLAENTLVVPVSRRLANTRASPGGGSSAASGRSIIPMCATSTARGCSSTTTATRGNSTTSSGRPGTRRFRPAWRRS